VFRLDPSEVRQTFHAISTCLFHAISRPWEQVTKSGSPQKKKKLSVWTLRVLGDGSIELLFLMRLVILFYFQFLYFFEKWFLELPKRQIADFQSQTSKIKSAADNQVIYRRPILLIS
jgi:hypothetical protein